MSCTDDSARQVQIKAVAQMRCVLSGEWLQLDKCSRHSLAPACTEFGSSSCASGSHMFRTKVAQARPRRQDQLPVQPLIFKDDSLDWLKSHRGVLVALDIDWLGALCTGCHAEE
eukprot:1316425-Amphidinium_carterae.1